MPLELSVGPQTSNKPPAPEPTPTEEEYPTQIKLPDGRIVWVSIPFPDRLTLIGAVGADHFLPSTTSEEDHLAHIRSWSRYIAEADGSKTAATHIKLNHAKQYYEEIVLTVGSSKAKVHVTIRQPTKAVPRWRLRLEMNPRRLGPKGFADLAFDLSYGDTFRLDRFLAEAKCTRLDVAVDFINAAVWEMVLHAGLPGKRVVYIGEDAELETVQLHKPAPASKLLVDKDGAPFGVKVSRSPLGLLHARLYDRVKERAGKLAPPPFGDVAVTRFEVMRTWKGNGPKLANLPALSNPLHPYRLSHITSGGLESDPAWRTYVAVNRTRPAFAAVKDMQLGPRKSLPFGTLATAPHNTLLAHNELWPRWLSGLHLAGLKQWIELAQNA